MKIKFLKIKVCIGSVILLMTRCQLMKAVWGQILENIANMNELVRPESMTVFRLETN